MMDELVPTLDVRRIERVVFAYDAQSDIATFHLERPRPGVTEEVEAGWYLRLADARAGDADVPDGTVLGLERHGFRRDILTHPVFARLLRPAIEEIESATGGSLDRDLWIEASPDDLPVTTRAFLVLLGYGMALWGAMMREEYAEEFEAYLQAARRASA